MGPQGQGSGTGRGMGYCGGAAGAMDEQSRGPGMGRGRRAGHGGGPGRRYRAQATGATGQRPAEVIGDARPGQGTGEAGVAQTSARDIEALKSQMESIQRVLEEMQGRVEGVAGPAHAAPESREGR